MQDSKTSVNYIRLINEMWQHIPQIAGCKASYLVLFFAVTDSINRNRWLPISLPQYYLMNKCHITNRTYLAGRTWLIKNNLINVQPGRNGYEMAVFSLGVAVQKDIANLKEPMHSLGQKNISNYTGKRPIPVQKDIHYKTKHININRSNNENKWDEEKEFTPEVEKEMREYWKRIKIQA
jgi:hypothetical protein